MAKKTITLETLADHIQKGFARMDAGFAAVADDIERLNDRVDSLATKDQLMALQLQVNGIEGELRDIKRTLSKAVFQSDLDEALRRIAAIEKRLGIKA
jgi:uncharacterized protein Yka (UPF0111/DUF47 family)